MLSNLSFSMRFSNPSDGPGWRSFRTVAVWLGLVWMGLAPRLAAQTVTNVIDAFNPAGVGTNRYAVGQITNVWGNWFGGAFQSLSWDSTSDANNNPNSGSLKITANFPVATDQFTVWDGITGIQPALNGVQYTNFQCDIRFAAGSAASGGNFGAVQFGMGTASYGQDYWNSGVTVSGSNTNWVHVSIPLNVNMDTNLSAIANVFVHIWGAGLVGPSTLWVDNIEFVGTATNTGTAVFNYTNTQQRIDGFGASSAWMSGMSAADADLLFSTNKGAGLSLLRTRIAPGGVIDDGEGTIAQLAQARGARVWSTPWSPPATFKTANSVNGGSYVDTAANNQAYAAEIAGYVGAMKITYGVNLYGVSVQNEPDVSVEYESCLWTSQQIHDYVPYLAAALTASNFTSTQVILPEDEHWQWNLAANTMGDLATSNYVGILACHNYGTVAAAVTQFGTPCPKTIWETEHFLGTDDSITNGLQLAQEIHSFMTVAQASAYHYWWLTGGGTGSIADNTANPARRLFVLGNYSKFVRPNFYRVGGTNTSLGLVSAYKDSGSTNFVIVAANPNNCTINQTLGLSNFPAATRLLPWVTSGTLALANQPVINVTNGVFNWQLPPWTVVTFSSVIGGAVYLTNTDAINLSSFDLATDSGGLAQANWSGGQWPTYVNDFYTGPYTVRTPAGTGNVMFPGRSLTVQNPLGLYLKGNSGSTVTINNLTLTNGGGVCQSLGSSTALTLAGNVTVAGGEFYNSADATRTITNAATLHGTGPLTNTGSGLVVYTGTNTTFTGPLIINSNTTVQAGAVDNLGGNPAAFNPAQLVLDNGALQPTASFALNQPNSGVTLNPGGGTFTVAAGLTLTLAEPVAGPGGLVLTGGGSLLFSATTGFPLNTTVNSGVLAVVGSNPLAGASLNIANSGTLDLSALSAPLGLSNQLTLAGRLVLAASSAGGGSSLDAGSLSYGGTLTISNTGPAWVAGNSLNLFTANHYAGAFTAISPATPGTGLLWDTSKLAVNGTLVVGVAPGVSVTPAVASVTYGNPLVLAAVPTGTGPLAYQWYDNHANAIAGGVFPLLTNLPVVAGSGNYQVVVTNDVGRATNFATVTVTPAALTVTANNTNRPYGAPNPVFTASYRGLVNGDLPGAAISGTPALATSATINSPTGTYAITAAVGTLAAANYSFNFVNGLLTVSLAGNPTSILSTVSGSTLTLSWPLDHLGWTLQAQTNALGAGLGSDWVDVAGSAATNQWLIPLDPNQPTVFYRLRQ